MKRVFFVVVFLLLFLLFFFFFSDLLMFFRPKCNASTFVAVVDISLCVMFVFPSSLCDVAKLDVF